MELAIETCACFLGHLQIGHAFVICIDTTIQVDDLPQHILAKVVSTEKPSATPLPLEDAEMQAIRSALEKNDFNRTQTARELGISRNTLWRKMKKYGIAATGQTNP